MFQECSTLAKLSLGPVIRSVVSYCSYTEKKENQIFLICEQIQNGAVAKSYMTNGLLIYGEIFAHFLHILGSPSSYMTAPLWISLHMRNLIFFFISVWCHLKLKNLFLQNWSRGHRPDNPAALPTSKDDRSGQIQQGMCSKTTCLFMLTTELQTPFKFYATST